MMAGMWLWWIVIIAAVVAAGWLVASRSRSGSGESDDPPELILKRRFARGEIDRETYERMLLDLKK